MATVYVAVDKRLGRDVAVKVMHQHLAQGVDGAAFVSRFRREGRAAARLAHANTVAVFDQGLDGDISFIVEEYVPGTNLRKELKTFGTLPLGKSLAVLEQVLAAVGAAHRKGLIHRDIKPENVLIDDNGSIKITDFGLARAVTEVTSTTTGTILGTMAYLAPEVIAAGICDPRTDVYAIGIMGYEILTGRLPHDANSPIQMAFQQVHEDVPAPITLVPWLPPELSDLMARFTARNPGQRPVDGDHALAELRAVRDQVLAEHPHLLGRRAAPPEDYEEPDTGEIPGLGEGIGSAELAAELDELAESPAHAPVPPPGLGDEEPETAVPLDSLLLHEIPTSPFTPAEGVPLVPVPSVTGSLPSIVSAASTTGIIELPDDLVASAPKTGRRVSGRSKAAKPRRRSAMLFALLASLLLVAGVGAGLWWWFTGGPGAWTAVPERLIDMPEESAISYLTSHHLLTEVHRQYSDDAPTGEVVGVAPPPGTRVRRGEIVQLTISDGVRKVTVPRGLIGAYHPDAEAALREAGVRFGPLAREYSDTVPLGQIISVSEPEGTEIPHYTVVTVTISSGRRPITVPQQVGRTRHDAEQLLDSLGLLVFFTDDEPSDSMPKGIVVSQDPPNGTIVLRGDTIRLTVSSGPPGEGE